MPVFLRRSSPRPWGCFYTPDTFCRNYRVFPTPVGVFLCRGILKVCRFCLPHARGGVSGRVFVLRAPEKSSPRPWGCFSTCTEYSESMEVFPTPVGVFLNSLYRIAISGRLPHARGGVSPSCSTGLFLETSSPRPWGCFYVSPCRSRADHVFPTPVGVFLYPRQETHRTSGLPHARGGVSKDNLAASFPAGSSPRPWGCFF